MFLNFKVILAKQFQKHIKRGRCLEKFIETNNEGKLKGSRKRQFPTNERSYFTLTNVTMVSDTCFSKFISGEQYDFTDNKANSLKHECTRKNNKALFKLRSTGKGNFSKHLEILHRGRFHESTCTED